MTNTQEALKMAIESMNEAMWENTKDTGWATLGRDYLEHLRLACIACKEALEQQEHICGDRPAIADRLVTLQSNNIVRDEQGTIIGHLVKSRDALIETAREEGREIERRKQQEQEPLGTVDELVDECVIHGMKLDRNAKLYTHPAKQLSDDEIIAIHKSMPITGNSDLQFARAIEAKVRGE